MNEDSFLLDDLAVLRKSGRLRSLRDFRGASGPLVQIGTRQALMLCSNNYLGLAGDPRMKAAAQQAVADYGTASTGSRLISGNSELYESLESELARFKGCESTLIFASGYHANIGAISALAGPDDAIFSDALNHASIIDGCRLSRASVHVYRHCDAGHLEDLLRTHGASRRKLVVSESIFSMDGDIAPLEEISVLTARHGAMLMVDEAHATGVAGKNGAGVVQALGLGDKVDVQMGTFSKAMASLGGYVAASRTLISYLLNQARSFIFTTGLPPAVLAASREALRLVQAEPERRASLARHAETLKQGLQRLNWTLGPTQSQIIPAMIGAEKLTMAACRFLLRHGIFVQGIRPPTVPPGTARLRLTPMATHTDVQIQEVLEAFGHLAGLLKNPRRKVAVESR